MSPFGIFLLEKKVAPRAITISRIANGNEDLQ